MHRTLVGNSTGVPRTLEKILPVEIDWVPTPIRVISKSKVTETEVEFPTLPLSSWMRASFDLGGHFFLGGKGIEQVDAFCEILHDWWVAYKPLDPDLPLYSDFDESTWAQCLPVAIHGDEGRGRYKRPVMIFSYQPIITNLPTLRVKPI